LKTQANEKLPEAIKLMMKKKNAKLEETKRAVLKDIEDEIKAIQAQLERPIAATATSTGAEFTNVSTQLQMISKDWPSTQGAVQSMGRKLLRFRPLHDELTIYELVTGLHLCESDRSGVCVNVCACSNAAR